MAIKGEYLQDEEGTPVINLSSDNVSKVALLPLSEAAAKWRLFRWR